jgi:CheY-like chemotaxis protein
MNDTTPPSKQSKGPRILLAEDDGDFRLLLAKALRDDGYDVVEARDGFELVKLLAGSVAGPPRAPSFALVISDVRMPGWTGLEVLMGLSRYHLAAPTVLVSAFFNEKLRAQAERCGAVALLEKPFTLDELLRIVSETVMVRPAARSSS